MMLKHTILCPQVPSQGWGLAGSRGLSSASVRPRESICHLRLP